MVRLQHSSVRAEGPFYLGLVALSTLALASCVTPSTEVADEGETSSVIEMPGSTLPDSQTVCDPFANNPAHPAAGLDMGLVGSIRYLTDDQPRYTRAVDYQSHGVPIQATLFMDEVSIPTRKFDLGFVTRAGTLIQNAQGNSLYEYFSLKLESEIRLGANDRIGRYQFALLADDGAVLSLDIGNGFTKIVDDDGTHATKMACSTTPIAFDLNSSIPAKIEYYQGPRYHIALMVLWREWPENDPSFNPNDPQCGTSGNDRFFNFNVVPSAPTAIYNGLLARGWKVLKAENYALPRAVSQNPCKAVEPVRTFITSTTPSIGPTNNTSFTVNFNSNFATSTFECSLDGATPTACMSPKTYSGLAAGSHTFQVWAKDSSGRRDETGASQNWVVDLTPPLASAIAATTTSTTLTVTWTTNELATSSLQWGPTSAMTQLVADDGAYKLTHSITVTGLNPSTPYFYKVLGRDQAGNTYQSSRFGILTKP